MSVPILRCVCSYCGILLRVGDAPEPISHGICRVCEARLHAELDADDARHTA